MNNPSNDHLRSIALHQAAIASASVLQDGGTGILGVKISPEADPRRCYVEFDPLHLELFEVCALRHRIVSRLAGLIGDKRLNANGANWWDLDAALRLARDYVLFKHEQCGNLPLEQRQEKIAQVYLECYDEAEQIVDRNLDEIRRVADALLEKGELRTADLIGLLRG